MPVRAARARGRATGPCRYRLTAPSIPNTRLSVSNCAISWRRVAPSAMTDGDFSTASLGTRQQKTRDVRTRNEQNERHGAEKREQRRPDVSHNPFVQGDGERGDILLRVREIPARGCGRPFRARSSLVGATRRSSAGPAPAPIVRPATRRQIARGEDQRLPELGGRGKAQIRRGDTDNRDGAAVERGRSS